MHHARLENGAFHPLRQPSSAPANGNGNRHRPLPVRTEPDNGWSVQAAEKVLHEIKGVISARIVQRPAGAVQEIHVLTVDSVPPKKTVRRIESAFLRHFGMKIDHRKVSVACSRWPIGDRGKKAKSSASFLREPTFPGVGRPHMQLAESVAGVRLDGHEVEVEPSGRARVRVFLDVDGEGFMGEATGSGGRRARLATLASATVDALMASSGSTPKGHNVGTDPSLSLEDVDLVDAFDKGYVLASVTAIGRRGVKSLVGAAPVEESIDRAVILSILNAAQGWLREDV